MHNYTSSKYRTNPLAIIWNTLSRANDNICFQIWVFAEKNQPKPFRGRSGQHSIMSTNSKLFAKNTHTLKKKNAESTKFSLLLQTQYNYRLPALCRTTKITLESVFLGEAKKYKFRKSASFLSPSPPGFVNVSRAGYFFLSVEEAAKKHSSKIMIFSDENFARRFSVCVSEWACKNKISSRWNACQLNRCGCLCFLGLGVDKSFRECE